MKILSAWLMRRRAIAELRAALAEFDYWRTAKRPDFSELLNKRAEALDALIKAARKL